MIQNYISDNNEFITAWRKVLTKAPVDFVTYVAISTQQYYEEYKLSHISPINVAASDGSVDLYKQMMIKLVDMNPENIFGNNHPIFIAAGRGHFDIYKHIFWQLVDKNPRKVRWGHPTIHCCTKWSQ